MSGLPALDIEGAVVQMRECLTEAQRVGEFVAAHPDHAHAKKDLQRIRAAIRYWQLEIGRLERGQRPIDENDLDALLAEVVRLAGHAQQMLRVELPLQQRLVLNEADLRSLVWVLRDIERQAHFQLF